jgi:class 3 adenylate cyclase/tetratricopeptide (TPR) repeat protein
MPGRAVCTERYNILAYIDKLHACRQSGTEWPMQQIADWLEELGLPEYAQRFAEQDVDIAILPDLTDQDLKDLGVVSLGHRRKLLRAIAALDGAPGEIHAKTAGSSATAAPSSAAAGILLGPAPEQSGERRYLTVMFCDLVGSTGISAQLDAEEWRDIVSAYLGAGAAAVTEMGGHVAKKLGDGLLALFGYPVAHENDAERAVRAALSIQRALAELNRRNIGSSRPELAARIGLESGPAVLDAAGEIYGDVANVAARVQALAEPGAVLVTAQVQRQVAGLFVAEERGTHALKGVPEPTRLFRLVRASGGGRRSGQRLPTPLVGRDHEMAMLVRHWERVQRGDGQLLMIAGEPGLGKSRLIEEFHSQILDTPHTWVEWSCSQLLQNTPLHPIAEWGRQRFGGADVPGDRRLAELESSLAQVKLAPAENASLLAPLIDIPLPNERVPDLSAEELRRRQLAALINWVMASAKVQPVVLAFEDLHWADPTTLDVLRGIAERGALSPLYVVATSRPEFRAPWGMRAHHCTISLAPLERPQVREMVTELSARHALTADLVEDVAARTGGVPLFVEEVTRLLLERGRQSGIQTIPPTLQQSLMARLDRLGAAREVAQIGSVIGRGFSYLLLRDVAGMKDHFLQAALEKLAEADIVLVQGLPPDSDYRFKHALIQDAAYENLLKTRRQVLHRRVAEILRDRLTDMPAVEPELLAHHFTQAGLTDAAIEWWGKAGDQALHRSAFQEAISHLGKAIEMADKEGNAASPLPPDAEVAEARAKIRVDYARAIQWRHGFGAEEARAAIERAGEFAGAAPGQPGYWRVTYARFAASLVRGELRTALEIAETYLRQAEIEGRPEHEVAARRMLGTVKFELGAFSESREEFERMVANWDEDRDKDLGSVTGSDVLCVGWSYMAQLLATLGELESALHLSEEAIRRSEVLGDFGSFAFATGQSLLVVALSGHTETVLRRAEAFGTVASEKGAELWASNAKGWASWARGLLTHDAAAAVEELREIVNAKRERQYRQTLHGWFGLLAELQGAAGAVGDALDSVAEGLALAESTAGHRMDAHLHRLRGDILARLDPTAAETAYREALRIAQAQRARTFELQAALGLARLLNSAVRAAEVRDVLGQVLEGFSPSSAFRDINEARTLLEGLASS